MSAIAGIVFLDGRQVEDEQLARMALTLRHRGVDGWAYWSSGSAGLAHMLLRNTPESLGETQPMFDPYTSCVISADLRLDNRAELAGQLGLSSDQAAQFSDSQYVLCAYEKWGTEMPAHLLGDFALAIWDGRQQRLFLARDPFGARGLYYCYIPNKFLIFASEIKALLTFNEVPRALNQTMLALYLSMVGAEAQMTMYEHIQRLPAAHSLALEPDAGPTLATYWRLDYHKDIHFRSDAEYAEAFREVFSAAVASRVRSAYPTGAMLSGGLDSSSITCLARERLQQSSQTQLRSYSIVFPELAEVDTRINEMPFIDAVVAQGGLEHHAVDGKVISLFDPAMLAQFDHIPAPSMYIDWLVFSEAAQNGTRTILSGTDGDTVVHYGYYFIAELLSKLRLQAALREVHLVGKSLGWRRGLVLWEFGLSPFIPDSAHMAWSRLTGNPQQYWDKRSLISPAFAEETEMVRLAREKQTLYAQLRARPSRMAHYYDLTAPMWQIMLEQISELAGTVGVQTAFPFFDRRVVEFCLALPGDQKLRHGVTRYILRQAMQGILPTGVQNRKTKGNMSSNFYARLHEFEAQRLANLVSTPSPELEAMVDQAALRNVYLKYQQDPIGATTESFQLFWVASLDYWLKRFA